MLYTRKRRSESAGKSDQNANQKSKQSKLVANVNKPTVKRRMDQSSSDSQGLPAKGNQKGKANKATKGQTLTIASQEQKWCKRVGKEANLNQA